MHCSVRGAHDYYDGIPADQINAGPAGEGAALAFLPGGSLLLNAGYAVFQLKPERNASGQEVFKAFKLFGHHYARQQICSSGIQYAPDKSKLLLGVLPKFCSGQVTAVAAQTECSADGSVKVAIAQRLATTSQILLLSVPCESF